jgi:hypothetical protein
METFSEVERMLAAALLAAALLADEEGASWAVEAAVKAAT